MKVRVKECKNGTVSFEHSDGQFRTPICDPQRLEPDASGFGTVNVEER